MITSAKPSAEAKPLDYIRDRPSLLNALLEGITEGRAVVAGQLRYVKSPLYAAIADHIFVHEFLARRLSADDFVLAVSKASSDNPRSAGGQLRHVKHEADGNVTEIILRNGYFTGDVIEINSPLGPCATEFIEDQGAAVTASLFDESRTDATAGEGAIVSGVNKHLVVLIERKSLPNPDSGFDVVENYYLVHPIGYPNRKTMTYSDIIKLNPGAGQFLFTSSQIEPELLEFNPDVEEIDEDE